MEVTTMLLNEEQIDQCIRLTMMKAFPILDVNSVIVDCIRESLLVEVLDSVPTTLLDAEKRFMDMLIGHDDVGVEEEEIASFLSLLVKDLLEISSKSGQADDDDEDVIGDGCCAMCERPMPLTKHHLIPRAVHADYRKKGATAEELARGILICRPCHSAIHHNADIKELAAHYDSLDKIMANEAIQKFVSWVCKQHVTSKNMTHNQIRYRR
jgi:hypothetical protein